MCCCNEKNQKKEGCQKPENLKTRPKSCSTEQILKCHGDVKRHPCAPGGKRKERRA
jgi:hypothetical protein